MTTIPTEYTVLLGAPGTGKTTELMQRVAASLRAGRSVALVCFDYGEERVLPALAALGAPTERLVVRQMNTPRPQGEIEAVLLGRAFDELYFDGPAALRSSYPELLAWFRVNYPALAVCLTAQAARKPDEGVSLADAFRGADHVVRCRGRGVLHA